MRLPRGHEPSDDVWMQGLGTPLWVQFRHFTEDPAEIEAMVATYSAYNLAHHDELGRPYADRKSTRLNSSHLVISYAVFCLKKKKYDSSDSNKPAATWHMCRFETI